MRNKKLTPLSSCGILASIIVSGSALSQEGQTNSAPEALSTRTEVSAPLSESDPPGLQKLPEPKLQSSMSLAQVKQSIDVETAIAREFSEARGDSFPAALRDLVTRGTPTSEIYKSGLAYGIVAEAHRNLMHGVEPSPVLVTTSGPDLGLALGSPEPEAGELVPAQSMIDQGPGFASSLGIASGSSQLDFTELEAPLPEIAPAEAEAAIRAISPGEFTGPVDATGRIWRGARVTEPDPYPDVALILGKNQLCSGTLVTPEHVITAAHCLCRGVSKQVLFGLGLLDTEVYRVRVDEARSKSMVSCDELSTDAGMVSNIRKGDVAVLRLQEPVTHVTPRKIASDGTFIQSVFLRAIGFGRTETGMVGLKYHIDILIASHSCTTEDLGLSSNAQLPCTRDLEMVAAGLNRDTCAGDSGGPVNVLTSDVQLVVAGTVSRALDPRGECGPGGIYVNLRHPDVEEFLLAQGIPASSFLE